MTAADPLLGRRMAGRYLVTATIARGTMGRVYEAEQEPLGRRVALKVLDVRGDPADHERQHARFLREAAILGGLSHPNTVRVFDYGTQDDQHWLAMELVKGRSLEGMLGDGPLDPLRAVRIARQICASLSEAHSLGLVHRDLKPANVLIETRDGADRVKVVDFGLVKEVDGAEHLTAEGLMLGTPMYMSPEQIRGDPVDRRTDVYALGVLLYRAVVGSSPFPEGHTASLLLAHLSAPPTDPGEVAPELPRCLKAAVLRCLEKDPDDRFATMQDASRALDRCEATLLGELPDDPDPSAAASSQWRTLGVALAITAVTSFALGFVVMRLWRAHLW